jgi:hypothetical protein
VVMWKGQNGHIETSLWKPLCLPEVEWVITQFVHLGSPSPLTQWNDGSLGKCEETDLCQWWTGLKMEDGAGRSCRHPGEDLSDWRRQGQTHSGWGHGWWCSFLSFREKSEAKEDFTLLTCPGVTFHTPVTEEEALGPLHSVFILEPSMLTPRMGTRLLYLQKW